MVAPLDRDFMRSIYELRLGIEPLAATLAARNAAAADVARGEALLASGNEAARRSSIGELIGADMQFHMYLYELFRQQAVRRPDGGAVEPFAPCVDLWLTHELVL